MTKSMSLTEMDQVLIKAVHCNDQRQIEAIINNGFNINGKFLDTTLLTEAICCGHKDLATRLIQCGADPNLGNKQFPTPLAAAAAKNDHLMVQVLLDSGCDISKLNDGRVSYQIRTPLHYAISHGNITMVRKLIEKGHNVNYPTLGDLHPMHDAIMADNAAILKLVVDHPSFNKGFFNEYWRAPLYQSLFINSKLHIAEVLLDCQKFGLYFEGHSLLEVLLEMAAGVKKKVGVTKLILAAGCDALHITPFRGSVYKYWLESGTILGGVEERITIIDLFMQAGLIPSMHESKLLEGLARSENELLFCKTVKDIAKQPQSLQEKSKSVIRATLGPYNSDKISQLPLPHLIKNYIALKHITKS